MRQIVFSIQFRKDLKRYKHNAKKLARLFEIIKYLETDTPIPAHYKPHTLSGRYTGCLECHLLSDFLLIWRDEQTGLIHLLRLGTHSELF
ncbi:MAG: type II toxin-antitoxin system YafQ family toxin [Alloprevotella sp.]|nr:type II toxin-antitoxin system YafQ family toxin [Alloprevotella sp.]